MLGLPYIAEIFTAVLQHSMVMQGRLHVCPKWASELNDGQLGELVKAATQADNYRSFPAAFMMPPTLTGDLATDQPRLVQYPITMLFLTQTGVTADNLVKDPDALMETTTHTVVHDWHDMQRAAQEFLRALDLVVRDNNLQGLIHVSQKVQHSINYISEIANPRLSGVSVNFAVNLFTSCVGNEDYPADVASQVVLPSGDSHPAHLH